MFSKLKHIQAHHNLTMILINVLAAAEARFTQLHKFGWAHAAWYRSTKGSAFTDEHKADANVQQSVWILGFV